MFGTQTIPEMPVPKAVTQSLQSFQHFSNSYTLKDGYRHCFTTMGDATIMVSHTCPIIGKQVAFTHPYTTGYDSNNTKC